MDYLVLKWIHVLSSTILFGAGAGSAFHLFAASLRRRIGGVASASRNVVLADWLLTTPTAVLQPLTGIWLVHLMGVPFATPWVAWSLGLYVFAIACWIPVVWIRPGGKFSTATGAAFDPLNPDANPATIELISSVQYR